MAVKYSYKDAGVDLDVYAESMARLPHLLRRTHSPRVMPLEGGFAGLFQLDFAGPLFARKYQQPVLVSCADGVGTKLQLATLTGRHNTIGIDLVAMSVNDALCTGAEPLFFLDYVLTSKDDPNLLEQVVAGISAGCIEADCALLGGETAIHPDTFPPGEYDLAGFCVAVVEKNRIIDGKAIAPGDVLLGVASSGLHSNGFTLARKLVFEAGGLNVDSPIAQLGGQTVGEVMLTPTRIYSRPLRRVLHHYRVKQVVHGIAHITGGGLLENLQRILPANVSALVDKQSWQVPPVFGWLQELGGVDEAEMFRVFNMGVGLVLAVSPYYAESIQAQLCEDGCESWILGEIVAGDGSSRWK